MRRLQGGEPLLWVVPKRVPTAAGVKEEYVGDLLPEHECRSIMKFLKAEFGCEDISKELLNALFTHIKIKVYANDSYRRECIKMLTKANFYSTMAVLLMLSPVILRCAECVSGGYGVVLYISFIGMYFIAPAGWCIDGDMLAMAAVAWPLAVLCAARYRFFNIIYNRLLLSSYLVIEKEKEKKG